MVAVIIDGIILAAGLSKRFGTPKQLISWKGRPLVGHVADVALSAKLRQVVAVTGHVAGQVRAALASVSKSERLRIVFNPEYRDGQPSNGCQPKGPRS
jgi:molybdenum cofactor cytidylyltransferase